MKKEIKALSLESKKVWDSVHREWTLSKLEEIYLQQALAHLDNALDCEATARREGFSLEDRTGRKYLNPLLTQAKISRNNYLRVMKLVGFERVLKEKVKRRPGRPTDYEAREAQGETYADAKE